MRMAPCTSFTTTVSSTSLVSMRVQLCAPSERFHSNPMNSLWVTRSALSLNFLSRRCTYLTQSPSKELTPAEKVKRGHNEATKHAGSWSLPYSRGSPIPREVILKVSSYDLGCEPDRKFEDFFRTVEPPRAPRETLFHYLSTYLGLCYFKSCNKPLRAVITHRVF
jgi:hypothetical protein